MMALLTSSGPQVLAAHDLEQVLPAAAAPPPPAAAPPPPCRHMPSALGALPQAFLTRFSQAFLPLQYAAGLAELGAEAAAHLADVELEDLQEIGMRRLEVRAGWRERNAWETPGKRLINAFSPLLSLAELPLAAELWEAHRLDLPLVRAAAPPCSLSLPALQRRLDTPLAPVSQAFLKRFPDPVRLPAADPAVLRACRPD